MLKHRRKAQTRPPFKEHPTTPQKHPRNHFFTINPATTKGAKDASEARAREKRENPGKATDLNGKRDVRSEEAYPPECRLHILPAEGVCALALFLFCEHHLCGVEGARAPAILRPAFHFSPNVRFCVAPSYCFSRPWWECFWILLFCV